MRLWMCWLVLCVSVALCGPVWAGKPLPAPGKHPYFSTHRAAWKKLVVLLRATKQLEPIKPRRFPMTIAARTYKKHNYLLQRHEGEVILLTRWATWCKSCKYDLVAKKKLAQRVRALPVAIVGVSHEPFRLVARYHQRAPGPKKFPISLVDPRGVFARYLPGAAYPATTMIDPWGWMIAGKVGPGLWITPAYKALFAYLRQLAPLAWKALPKKARVCLPRGASTGRRGH